MRPTLKDFIDSNVTHYLKLHYHQDYLAINLLNKREGHSAVIYNAADLGISTKRFAFATSVIKGSMVAMDTTSGDYSWQPESITYYRADYGPANDSYDILLLDKTATVNFLEFFNIVQHHIIFKLKYNL